MIRSMRRVALLAAVALVAVLPASTPATAEGSAKAAKRVAIKGCAVARHAGGEWRSYGHDLANTRAQPMERTITPTNAPLLAPVWTFSSTEAGGEGDFTGTPVIADGCLFAGSNDGWVFALNADTGAVVWKTHLTGEDTPGGRSGGGGVNASVAVEAGRVYVNVSSISAPYMAALSEATGKILWIRTIDKQVGADVYDSPVYFDGMIFAGWSGGSAELGDEADRHRFQGGFVLLDAATGKVLRKTYTIRPPDKDENNPKDEFAGGAVWATPAIDPASKFAYVGGGNPFRPEAEHPHTNAILKIDLNRRSRTFGKIVDSYKGTPDEYIPGFSELPCFAFPNNLGGAAYPQGVGSCGDIDMDFGASANLFRDPSGRLLVGEGQKSGIYHVVDARTMDRVWTSLVGPPSQVGGIVGSTAIDGQNVYGPITVGGYVWSIGREAGTPRWVAPTLDAAHWGNPVSTAGGVVYTVDLKGFLDAFDASTGVPLLHRPLPLQSSTDLMA
ncbi:MAG: PQQ-binding-like beta-propeller repeat protein, partial [Actinobacteria bacterium]|nr:PQQ-binding-like beta-propeller repeat protein [Actinomycetota bacterium]